jgi:hypothetical protein
MTPAERLRLKEGLAVARVLWQNRKAEIAIATALLALGREIVQAATGH